MVPDLRQWSETLDKIANPHLHQAKLAIRTNSVTKTFKTLAVKMKELAHETYKSWNPRAEQLVSRVKTGNPKPGGVEKKSFKDSELHPGNWTNANWNKLTLDQLSKVRQLREDFKAKKRSAKAAIMAETDDEDNSTIASGENAGEQFGRNAHGKKHSQARDTTTNGWCWFLGGCNLLTTKWSQLLITNANRMVWKVVSGLSWILMLTPDVPERIALWKVSLRLGLMFILSPLRVIN